MKIYLKKFGTLLVSRQAGKEAWAAFLPSLSEVGSDEKIEVDFEDVVTFSPSWGDEFLTLLRAKYGERVIYLNTENPSVKATLELLEKISKEKIST